VGSVDTYSTDHWQRFDQVTATIRYWLLVLGTLSAWWLYRRYGLSLKGTTEPRLRVHALLSTLCWLGALVCGRLVAFVE
jgi:hypothetical protein